MGNHPIRDTETMSEEPTSFVPSEKPDSIEEALAPQMEILELCLEAEHGTISPEPRIIEGEFPGNRTRAMGHALEVIETLEEAGIEAEREYVGEMENYDLHRIDINIRGQLDE